VGEETGVMGLDSRDLEPLIKEDHPCRATMTCSLRRCNRGDWIERETEYLTYVAGLGS